MPVCPSALASGAAVHPASGVMLCMKELYALADDRAFSMSDVSQNTDQQWLDGVMRYLGR